MANVSSNNLTTLYSGGGVNVRPTSAYGNANVVSLLNVGTDGGNTVTNIIASGNLTTGGEINSAGNITAPWFLGNVIGNISGNIVVPGSNTAVLYNDNGSAGASDNLKFNFSSNVLTANGNIVANYFIGNGSGLSSLTGANVTGAVGLATYATTANSVALANVSGAGNIASINIDGSSSNVLFGNGVFAPGGGGNAANANYANFAGTAFSVSGSNVSGEVANAAYANIAGVANSVAGSNVSGTVANATYAANAGNATVANSANSVAVGNVSGIGNIATINLDGNASNILYGNGAFSALPIVSNVANANYANFAGTAFSVAGSNVSGEVANAAYANAANTANLATYATTANSVAGANVSGEVANANYASFANVAASANSVAVANVSGIGNIATINLDGNSSNVLFGNGVFAPESTTIANANYANFAGTVITNAQPNITSTGNLTSLNVVDSANVTGTIQQLAPNTITITTNTLQNTAYNLTTIYGETSNIQESGQRAIIRSRGNVSTPATTVVNDVGARDRVYFYNGTTNALGFTSSVTLSNLNSNSNAYSTGTNYNMGTGNPNGDQGNANASSGLNLLSLRDTGQLLLIPGANSTAASMLNMFNYGLSTSLATAQGLTMSRARGNRDANLSVQANDQIGRLVFQAHNGTSFVTNRLPIIRATVDSSYTANTANIPAGFQMITCDNTTNYTHQFYANGNVQFANSLQTLGNIAVFPSPLATGQANVTLYNGNLDVGNNGAGTGGWVNTINLRGFANVFGAFSSNGYMYCTTMRATSTMSGDSEMRLPGAGTANVALYANGVGTFTGNITSANANLGNLVTANYFSGNLTGNTSIANLSLTKFQETVVSGGTVSGTLTPNSTAGTIYNYTLNGNITINALGNAVSGTSMTLILTQDGTGNRILTSSMKFAGGLKTLSTAASATDIMSVFYDGTTYYATLSRGFV